MPPSVPRSRSCATRSAQAATVLAAGYGTARDRVADLDTDALTRQWAHVLEGVVQEGRERAGALRHSGAGGRRTRRAVTVLPGRRRPVTRRGLPWAVGASLAGAAGGVALALVVRRVLGQDAPDAQEPEQLRAVVDAGPGASPVARPSVASGPATATGAVAADAVAGAPLPGSPAAGTGLVADTPVSGTSSGTVPPVSGTRGGTVPPVSPEGSEGL